MPNFPGVKKLGQGAQDEWKNFILALKAHEDGHVNIIMNGYNGKGGYNGVIDDMVGKTDAEAINILTVERTLATQAASDEYDFATSHGPTLDINANW